MQLPIYTTTVREQHITSFGFGCSKVIVPLHSTASGDGLHCTSDIRVGHSYLWCVVSVRLKEGCRESDRKCER